MKSYGGRTATPKPLVHGGNRSARADDPRLDDRSPDLWDTQLSSAARRLLTEGVRCFAAHGFQATSTRDIAARAGLSPSALYVHFATKEQLLYAMTRMGHSRILDEVRNVPVTDAASHLRALVSHLVAWHARHHMLGRVGTGDLMALEPTHYEDILRLRREILGMVRHAIGRGVSAGAFYPVDAHGVARAVVSMGIDVARWYPMEGTASPETLGENYAELALRMVGMAGDG
ncbi:TetR/AcrR family transcriptional regulator [Streptomyces sp. NPDC046805]|uniref:TetR/AcrR family transcriptional regulator n=1 Tax=Streptomyces sp. NPDC046805 TaxID=3155134 RepID=UPI0033C6649F